MIANTAIAAVYMGVVGFAAFRWMLHAGWSEAAARNGLLLLMVLFENVQIGNCRSETRSALLLSPLRSPLLLCGAIGAFTVHVATMHLELGQRVLGTRPVTLKTWLVLAAIALSLLVVMECFKWIRRVRRGDTLTKPR
jgi:hypothetical protein